MRRGFLSLGTFLFLMIAGPAWACGGLVSGDGAISLVRTTTLSAYVDGVEHYVTRFEFQGAGGKFGSIVPLPDVPTRIRKGGDWTLERLVLETQPIAAAEAALAPAATRTAYDVRILEQKRIGALDITVLEGGGFAVGRWAEDNGFRLSPDAPEVLDFYARRSPVFMAAKFDSRAARQRGIVKGEGTTIHLSIPTDDPWVPLRILALGQPGDTPIDADVYLLTERAPALLPGPGDLDAGAQSEGLTLARSEPASRFLLSDLRSDRGMAWLPPRNMWLTYLVLNETAGDLTYDLAIDASGRGEPSPVDAGLTRPPGVPVEFPGWVWAAIGGMGLLAGGAALAERRRSRWA